MRSGCAPSLRSRQLRVRTRCGPPLRRPLAYRVRGAPQHRGELVRKQRDAGAGVSLAGEHRPEAIRNRQDRISDGAPGRERRALDGPAIEELPGAAAGLHLGDRGLCGDEPATLGGQGRWLGATGRLLAQVRRVPEQPLAGRRVPLQHPAGDQVRDRRLPNPDQLAETRLRNLRPQINQHDYPPPKLPPGLAQCRARESPSRPPQEGPG